MGCIYKIQNKRNSKIYIGQTSRALKDRIKAHFYTAKIRPFKEGSLHYDMAVLGPDSFDISVLEECQNNKLSEREIYWISYYNSFEQGYNETHGGAGSIIAKSKENKMIALAKCGKTLTEIASEFGCSLSCVRQVLNSNEVEFNRGSGAGPLKVVMYDTQWKPLRIWDSISDSYRGMRHGQSSESSHQHKVRIACKTGELLFGHHWAMLEDLVVIKDGRQLLVKSQLDLEAFENGEPYHIEDNKYIIIDTEVEPKQISHCRFCGEQIKSGETVCGICLETHPRCSEALEKRTQQRELRQSERKEIRQLEAETKQRPARTTPKADLLPSKEVLSELMKTMTYTEIERKYGVAAKTLRDKLREYGIYEHKIQQDVPEIEVVYTALDTLNLRTTAETHKISVWKLNNILDKFNIPRGLFDNTVMVGAKQFPNGPIIEVFASMTEAMESFYGDGGTTASRSSLRWKIGNAAKTGTKCKGYYWEILAKCLVAKQLKSRILSDINK